MIRSRLLLSSRISLQALLLAALFVAASIPSLAGTPPRKPHNLVVGYFPQWGLYARQPYYVKALITNGSAARLGQINYSQGAVRDGHCSIADPNADLNYSYSAQNSVDGRADSPASPFRGYFHQLEELRRHYPRIRILISLEGRASDFADDARADKREAFVASCIDTFVKGHFAPGIDKPGIFDGFDVDWESPQVEDAANFKALLAEFRRQMAAVRPGLTLAVAVGQAPGMLPGTNFAEIAPLVDQVGIMNYDYAGPWSSTTGFVAPLFPTQPGPLQQASIEQSIASYKSAGVPAGKLLMGLPFYGYSWTAVSRTNNGLFQSGQAVHSDSPYNYIRTLASPSAVYRDTRSQAPWLYDGATFWTYEDPVSIRYKVSFAASQHLGGVMIWELSGDTTDGELVRTAYRTSRHPLKPHVFTGLLSSSAPDVSAGTPVSAAGAASSGASAY